MGFWGTIVVARSSVLLAGRADVLDFGHQHREVRALGDDWQVMITAGWQDPPNLAAAGERLVGGTSAPVFAAYVCDGDCAGIVTRLPDGWTSSMHLPPADDDCGYKHRPRPPARAVAEVVSDLVDWGQATGLTPDQDALRALVGHDPEASDYRSAEDLVFALLPALGFGPIGEPHPTAFDIFERPYSYLVGFFGLGMQARSRAAFREYSPDEPDLAEQPWEAVAIQLERDLWAALHRSDVDLAALRDRIEQVRTEYQRCRDEGPPTPTHVDVDGHAVQNIHNIMEQVYDGHVSGHVNPPAPS